jgi:hypothetical protein
MLSQQKCWHGIKIRTFLVQQPWSNSITYLRNVVGCESFFFFGENLVDLGNFLLIFIVFICYLSVKVHVHVLSTLYSYCHAHFDNDVLVCTSCYLICPFIFSCQLFPLALFHMIIFSHLIIYSYIETKDLK